TLSTQTIVVGRFPTMLLAHFQNLLFCFCFSFNLGMDGQNALLPNNANREGISVNPEIKMKTTATENAGAKELYGLNTVTNNVNMAKITVPPLKNIGSDT